MILGIKIRLGQIMTDGNDLETLGLAREAADVVRLPLMVHPGGLTPMKDILGMLRKGDVITHTFHGLEESILDARGRVLPAVRKAVEQGIHFDVGHGAGSFSFDITEKALQQDLLPGTISSDVHQFNANGPVFDLATTNPANTLGFPQGLGTLCPGAEADGAVFSLAEGDF